MNTTIIALGLLTLVLAVGCSKEVVPTPTPPLPQPSTAVDIGDPDAAAADLDSTEADSLGLEDFEI